MSKRSLPFLLVIVLFGVGLGFIVSSLDPLIYTEKVRQIAPPALKNTTLSFITIMALLVALVAQPLVGHWSDRTRSRWGPRLPFLSGGVIGLTLSLLLLALTESLWLLILAAMLISACANTVQGPWQALIPDYVPENQHGTAAGLKTVMEVTGAVGGVAVVTWSIAREQLWLTLLTAGTLFWLCLLLTLYTLRQTDSNGQGISLSEATASRPPPNRPLSGGEPTTSPPVGRVEGERGQPSRRYRYSGYPALLRLDLLSVSQVGAIFRDRPAFLWWIVNRLLFWSAGISIRTFLLNYMEDGLHLSLTDLEEMVSAGLLTGVGGAALLMVLLAGVMADRVGRRPLLVGAGLLAASGSLLLLLADNLAWLLIAVGLVGWGATIFISASWALATDLTPKREGALYLGLANGATVTGSISGRLGGPVIDALNQFTQTTTTGYLVIFGVAALFFVSSSLVVFKIPVHPLPTLHKVE